MTRPPPAASALSAIDACGIIAIVRGAFLAEIGSIVEALIAGGIRAIEISLTSPQAEEQIQRAVMTAGPRASIGAGTVLRAEQVEAVSRCGAAFVVSPVVDASVIGAALDRSMLVVPGACTPTEIVTAVNLGAAAVKLFPADTIPPAFVRAVLTPLPGLRLVPTGGVTLARAEEFAAAGAWAVGVGSPLVSAPVDLPALAARAARFVAALRPRSA
jgi:2-dehydro-3-deoxyphosphogluconate aldolase/(4S)-4-hydroxy-2-oxoglutarate aldolase